MGLTQPGLKPAGSEFEPVRFRFPMGHRFQYGTQTLYSFSHPVWLRKYIVDMVYIVSEYVSVDGVGDICRGGQGQLDTWSDVSSYYWCELCIGVDGVR